MCVCIAHRFVKILLLLHSCVSLGDLLLKLKNRNLARLDLPKGREQPRVKGALQLLSNRSK